jgi:hypothetical protein
MGQLSYAAHQSLPFLYGNISIASAYDPLFTFPEVQKLDLPIPVILEWIT